jgi:hypothetical protein
MKIAFFLLSLLAPTLLLGVHNWAYQDSLPTAETPIKGIGGETKGIYIGGGLAFISGITYGFIARPSASDGYGRTGLDYPLVASGLAISPSSLVGIGIAALLTREHSAIEGSFRVGVGLTLSPSFSDTPPFDERGQPDPDYVTGINIRVQSPQIGRWRYNLGLNHFFSRSYELRDGITSKSWQSVNLDLHYLFPIGNSFLVYPLVGSQYHNFVKAELYTNAGAGLNWKVYKHWDVFGEVKWSLDPDQDFNQANYSFGILYQL